MRHIQISSKTYRDNTGSSIDFPTILIEYNGETMILEQLHRYQIKNLGKSRTWHRKLVQVVGLMLDYMNANKECYFSAREFFDSFTESVYSGTIYRLNHLRSCSWLYRTELCKMQMVCYWSCFPSRFSSSL